MYTLFILTEAIIVSFVRPSTAHQEVRKVVVMPELFELRIFTLGHLVQILKMPQRIQSCDV